MLQNMRNRMQGIVTTIIAVLISFTFVFLGVQSYFSPHKSSPVVAVVNGTKILLHQVERLYEQKKYFLNLQTADQLNKQARIELKKNILQQLVKEELLNQAIEKLGLACGSKLIWSIVMGLPVFQINGQFSPERFQLLTNKVFQSEEFFLNNLQRSVLQSQLLNGIMNTAFILPNEQATIKHLLNQSRDLGYFIIDPVEFLANIQIAPAKIQAYYQQHLQQFTKPEQLSLQYLLLTDKQLPPLTSPTVEQLEQFYHTQQHRFTTPKKWEIIELSLLFNSRVKPLPAEVAKIKQRLTTAIQKSSAELTSSAIAQQFTVTRRWVHKKDLPQELANQIERLAVGRYSQPVLLDNRYSIIKVIAQTPATIAPYSLVTQQVQALYHKQQLAQQFAEASNRLADLTYINSTSLEPAAQEFRIPLVTTAFITKTGSYTGLLANPKLIKAAFSDSVVKQKYNSNVIELEPGKLLVLRLHKHIPSTAQPLAQVSKQITALLQQQEAQNLAWARGQELVRLLSKGWAPNDLAKKYHLNWQLLSQITSSYQDQLLAKAAFDLRQEPVASNIKLINYNNRYAVVKLLQVHPTVTHDLTAENRQFLAELDKHAGYYAYQLFVNQLIRRAKIKLYTEELS